MSRYYVIARFASKPSIFNLESHSVNLGHMGFALFIFALDIFQASCYSAPPLLEKAFSSTMKFAGSWLVLLSRINISLNAAFIYYYKNGVYLQQCFTAFFGSEKCTMGSTEIFAMNLLWTWVAAIQSRISRKYVAYASLFLCFCWKIKVLTVQCIAGFGKFRPDENW